MRVAFTLAFAVLLGCAATDGPNSATWTGGVGELIVSRCGPCHNDAGPTPLAFDTYEDARPFASRIATSAALGEMPPGGPRETAECASSLPLAGVEKALEGRELDLLQEWADAGGPRGVGRAPEPWTAPTGLLDQAGLVLRAAEPYEVPSDAADTFRCFVLDPGLTTTGWFDGVEVVPGAVAAVHHVLVFSVDPLDASTLLSEAAVGGGSFACAATTPAFTGLEMIASYAPGASAMETPAGSAMRIEAGGLILLQVHYHSTGVGLLDATEVRLRRSLSPSPRRARVIQMGNASGEPSLLPGPADGPAGPRFYLPAGSARHVETMEFEVPSSVQPLAIFAVGGHMHYAGLDVRVAHHKATGQEACLLQIPSWDFEAQGLYSFDSAADELPLLEPGDRLEVRCTYDNSPSNASLRRAFDAAGRAFPAPIGLGPNALDEMCVAVLGVVQPATEPL